MSKKKSDNMPQVDARTLRREAVASLRARRLTIRAIIENLKKLNPPIQASHATIVRDLKAIREEWKDRASEKIGEWIASELADMDELEKQAWREKRYDLVLKIKDRRAKLLGLDKPNRVELAGKDGGAIEVADARESIQRKLARIAAEQDEE